MDTNVSKTPAPLPLVGWQALGPAAAAREVHARVAALAPPLRSAALAWLRPEAELAAELSAAAGSDSVGASSLATTGDVAGQLAPTRGAARPLAGVPYFLKDLFDLAGVPTRAGSVFLEKVRPVPGADSAIVRRLRGLGAVCAGKTHLVEFASGLTGENPHYGDCPHPRFPDRLAGGSSSGSAALVAAGVAPLAIGTDTGGSVRVPAAFCGLCGFRLTPGGDFIRDAFPLAPTMDTAGWFTANAGDLLATWRALTGARASGSPGRGCHLPMSVLLPDADPETAAACDAAAARICPAAAPEVRAALLASWQNSVEAYVTIGMSEAYRVHHAWLAPHRAQYDPVIWQRFTDAGRYRPEQIDGARATLTNVRAGWRDFFGGHDFLVLPAAPQPAPRKADCTPQLRKGIIRLTAPASLGGLPVLSIPVPLPSGLTGGLQVVLPSIDSAVVPDLLGRI